MCQPSQATRNTKKKSLHKEKKNLKKKNGKLKWRQKPNPTATISTEESMEGGVPSNKYSFLLSDEGTI